MLLHSQFITKGNYFLPILCKQIDRLKLVISLITKKKIQFWSLLGRVELDSFIAVKSGWALDPQTWPSQRVGVRVGYITTTCAESQTAWERRPVTNKNVHCSPFIIMLNQVNVHNILFAKDRELKVW